MSTKIYKGFRLATDSMSQALSIVEGFRPWVAEQANQVMDAFIENMGKNGHGFIEAYDTWQEFRREIRLKQANITHADTDFTVVLIPSAGQLLGIVYTVHQKWYEQWCQQPGVEEYSYWDNVDEPEGMSEEEWARRDKAWSVLSDEPVSMQGFSIELVSPDGPLPAAWRELRR